MLWPWFVSNCWVFFLIIRSIYYWWIRPPIPILHVNHFHLFVLHFWESSQFFLSHLWFNFFTMLTLFLTASVQHLAYMWTLNVSWITHEWLLWNFTFSVCSYSPLMYLFPFNAIVFSCQLYFLSSFLYPFHSVMSLHPKSTPNNFLLVLMINEPFFRCLSFLWVFRMMLSSFNLVILSLPAPPYIRNPHFTLSSHPRMKWAPLRCCVG